MGLGDTRGMEERLEGARLWAGFDAVLITALRMEDVARNRGCGIRVGKR